MKTKWVPQFLLLLAAILLITAGCDGDDDNTVSDVNDLFGTWVQESVTINGVGADLADVLEWDEETVAGYLALYNDYTYEAKEVNASDSNLYLETGTFDIDDSWLIVTASTENGSPVTPHQVFNGQWSTNGIVLTLTQTVGNDTMVLTLHRPR